MEQPISREIRFGQTISLGTMSGGVPPHMSLAAPLRNSTEARIFLKQTFVRLVHRLNLGA